jgi:hypothetical protein
MRRGWKAERTVDERITFRDCLDVIPFMTRKCPGASKRSTEAGYSIADIRECLILRLVPPLSIPRVQIPNRIDHRRISLHCPAGHL